MKVPCKKTSRAGGAPPRTDALIGPAACGRCLNLDSLKRRASARALSLLTLSRTWLEHLLNLGALWNSSKLRPPTRAGPLDAHLGANHRKKSKTVPEP